MSSEVTRTCTRCDKEFEPGNWQCSDDGYNHIVAARTYYKNDAPQQDGRDKHGNLLPKEGRCIVSGIPPSRSVQEMSAIGWTPGADEQLYDNGGSVEFVNGRFETSDPEEQYWLDQKPSGYFCTESEWRFAWASPAEQERIQLEAKSRALDAGQARLVELQREIEQLRKGA